MTDLLTQRALQYIGRRHAAPFYLALHYTAPHWPWEGPTDTAASRTLRARRRHCREQLREGVRRPWLARGLRCHDAATRRRRRPPPARPARRWAGTRHLRGVHERQRWGAVLLQLATERWERHPARGWHSGARDRPLARQSAGRAHDGPEHHHVWTGRPPCSRSAELLRIPPTPWTVLICRRYVGASRCISIARSSGAPAWRTRLVGAAGSICGPTGTSHSSTFLAIPAKLPIWPRMSRRR